MSTQISREKSKPRVLLALLTSALVALSGLFVVPAVANAVPGPELSASVTDANETGITVHADFSGIAPSTLPRPQNSGVYFALVKADTNETVGEGAFVAGVGTATGADFGTADYTVDAADLVQGQQYEGLLWYAHGNPSDAANITRTPVEITDAQWEAIFPPAAPVVEGVATVTSASEAGITVHGSVTGVDPSSLPAGVHLGVVLRGTAIGATMASFLGDTASVASIPETGEISADVVIPATQLDETEEYELVVWPRRSNPSSENVVAILPFDVTPEQWEEVFPPAAPVTPTVEIVGNIADLDPEAENVVTVKGSGFLPNAPATNGTRPPLLGQFTGVYVVFGSFADVWQPSTGADGDTTRVLGDNKWASPASSAGMTGTLLEDDGTFEVELSLSTAAITAIEGGSYGIATYPGGGAKYAPFEIFHEVTFATDDTEVPVEPEEPNQAEISAQVTSATSTELNIAVEATGLSTDIRFAYAALIERGSYDDMDAAGGYVAMSPFTPVASGSSSFTLSVDDLAKLDSSKQYEIVMWKQHSEATAENFYGAGDVDITDAHWEAMAGPGVKASKPTVRQGEQITFSGTGLEAGVDVTATVRSNPVVVATKTTSALGAVSFDWTVPANFATGTHTIELSAGGTVLASNTFEVQAALVTTNPAPTAPVDTCVARAVTGGGFEWGLMEPFVSYLNGRIAQGEAPASTWYSATGGAVNVEAGGIGRIDFVGSFHGTGHHGELDYTLSNPSIQIYNASAGVLFATVNGSRIAYANLSFSGLAVNDGSVSAVASASLTPAGSATLSHNGNEFYGAGTALDSFSFSASLGAEVPCTADLGTDPVALAETGIDSNAGLAGMSLAAIAMLLGAGLLLARRRSSVTID